MTHMYGLILYMAFGRRNLERPWLPGIGNVLVVGEDKPPRGYFRIYIETMHEAMALGIATVTTQLAFWVKCTCIHQLSAISVQ